MKKITLICAVLLCAPAILSARNLKRTIEESSAAAAQQCVLMEERLTPETMPRSYENGKFVPSDLKWWCAGFYPGTCLYAYALTGDDNVKRLALRQTGKLQDIEKMNRSHDVGFQVMCSSGLAYKLTGDEKYLPVIKEAAEYLAARFSGTTKAIKSWDRHKEYRFPVIIDNMMNLELLTFAAQKFNRPEWREIAVTHANTTIRNHFREDYSSYHLVNYDPATGDVIRKMTVQGYADDSAWARGQAWGLYGYTVMYREVGDEAYLRQAENIAGYLLGRLKGNPVPSWDFDSPEELKKYKDASAAAVMASAFVELSTLTKDKSLARTYRKQAELIIRALSSPEYLAKPGRNGNFILMHSTGHLMAKSECDVPLSYADYYYLEALYRYKQIYL